MKRILIVVLILINLAMLGLLVAGGAKGQAVTALRGGNYIMFTARAGSDSGAVYIVDLATENMTAWRLDGQTRRLIPHRTRNLTVDFRPDLRQPQPKTPTPMP